jgi:hypothetical protein
VIWRWAISIWRTLTVIGPGSGRVEADTAQPLAESRTWDIVEDEEQGPPEPAEIEQIIDIDTEGHRLGETWTCRIQAKTGPADFALMTVRPLTPTKS